MGTRRSYSERLEDLRRRREELLQQEKALMARQIAQEKKERTRRWLCIGREIEAAVGHDVEDDDIELILESVRELLAQHPNSINRDNHQQNGNQDVNGDSIQQNDLDGYSNDIQQNDLNGHSDDDIREDGADALDDLETSALDYMGMDDMWGLNAASGDHKRFSQ